MKGVWGRMNKYKFGYTEFQSSRWTLGYNCLANMRLELLKDIENTNKIRKIIEDVLLPRERVYRKENKSVKSGR